MRKKQRAAAWGVGVDCGRPIFCSGPPNETVRGQEDGGGRAGWALLCRSLRAVGLDTN